MQSKGLKNQYDAMAMEEKKSYLASWLAEKMVKGAAKTLENTRKVESSTGHKRSHGWLGKKGLQNLLGIEKAQAKIDCGKLEHRPDPDSGRDDEWNREYKLYEDTGAKAEEENTRLLSVSHSARHQTL